MTDEIDLCLRKLAANLELQERLENENLIIKVQIKRARLALQQLEQESEDEEDGFLLLSSKQAEPVPHVVVGHRT